MEEFMDDKTDELDSLLTERSAERRKASVDPKPERKILFVAGACVLLIIVLIAIYFGRGNGTSNEESLRIQAKLNQLEDRLGQISGLQDRISYLEKREKSTQQYKVKTDRAVNALSEHIDILTKEFDRVQKKMVAVEAAKPKAAKPKPSKPPVQPKPVPPKLVPRSQGLFHEVNRGDTLYQISRKYGITVDELRRLNKMTKAQSIQPGQKLLVNPGNPE
ncbi:LysM peptidoglycan-binding domain-containing protein [bacterium]|nr:LysM peptidoglycan-binding domain-containing protein [bacterium]